MRTYKEQTPEYEKLNIEKPNAFGDYFEGDTKKGYMRPDVFDYPMTKKRLKRMKRVRKYSKVRRK